LVENPHSFDIVTRVAEFFVSVVKHNEELSNSNINRLIKTAVNCLTELVIGPCRLNQRILIENKKLLDSLNCILRMNLHIQAEEFSNRQMVLAQILNEVVIVG
jgi:hypothetical protein